MESEVVVSSNQNDEPERKSLSVADIHNVIKMEEIVRIHCVNVMKRNNVDHKQVSVHLSTDMNYSFNVIAGDKIKIILRWPDCLEDINSVMRDFCSLYHRKRNLRRTLELVPYAYSWKGRKDWVKTQFTSEDQIIWDILPKKRLHFVTREVTSLVDSVTGESIAISDELKTRHFDGNDVGLWIKMSRIVAEKENE